MEQVLGDVNKIIIDDGVSGGSGIVPYLPLDQLRGSAPAPVAATTTSGGTN